MKKIDNFKPFEGVHCETTAVGNLLKHLGIHISEPMMFGIGEGLGYIFWNMKLMDFPFIGGRIKPDVLTQNIATGLHLKLDVKETSSPAKAWETVKASVDGNVPVGLKLDCYHLDYFTNKIHFAGHYATIYGYDNKDAYLVDTAQQGSTVKTSLKNLTLARNEKGPMSSRNLAFTIGKNGKIPDLRPIIIRAIQNNASEYLNPPIQNVSYKGIAKTSKEIFKWFNTSKNIESDFATQAMLMEKAGTGGALFRNIYRDFLKESYELLKLEALDHGSQNFTTIAKRWDQVSTLFDKVAKTKNINDLKEASEILMIISQEEKNTMEILSKI
jgi:hypothetical protein